MGFAKEIRAAKASGQLMRIEREGFETGWLTGYVVSTGPSFFAFELVTGSIRFDGLACMRYVDVTSAAPDPHASFIEKALKARGAARATAAPINLASLPKMLESSSAAFPVITLHVPDEDMDGYACYIGKVIALNEASVDFHHITPDGAWENGLCEIPFTEIIRVDFGGDYEDALFLVAGPR